MQDAINEFKGTSEEIRYVLVAYCMLGTCQTLMLFLYSCTREQVLCTVIAMFTCTVVYLSHVMDGEGDD